jgi:hypothetical protein
VNIGPDYPMSPPLDNATPHHHSTGSAVPASTHDAGHSLEVKQEAKAADTPVPGASQDKELTELLDTEIRSLQVC